MDARRPVRYRVALVSLSGTSRLSYLAGYRSPSHFHFPAVITFLHFILLGLLVASVSLLCVVTSFKVNPFDLKMPMKSHLAPVEEDPDQSDMTTDGVRRRTASQSSEVDGPQGDNAESFERLEDIVSHPPLFWWAEPTPGHMFIAALMKVGVVYGFVWTINAIHSWLCTSAIGKFYRIWFYFCINLALLPLRSWYCVFRNFNAAVKRFGSNKLKNVLFNMERKIVSTYLKIDKELAFNVRDVIRKYPRLQETTIELIDDIFHHLLCNQIHPGALPTGEMIKKAAERQAIPVS